MFDARAIVALIKQGTYPSNWHVYYGISNYGCVIGWLILTVPVILYAISQYENIGFLLFLGILSALFIFAALIVKKLADIKKNSILVVLPEGVVQYYASNPENFSWLYFPDIDRIELAQRVEISGMDGDVSTKTYYWLDVYSCNGVYREWWIRNCFGDAIIPFI